jgi:hypothetical protein
MGKRLFEYDETDLSRHTLTSIVKYVELYRGGRYFVESVGGRATERLFNVAVPGEDIGGKVSAGNLCQELCRRTREDRRELKFGLFASRLEEKKVARSS